MSDIIIRGTGTALGYLIAGIIAASMLPIAFLVDTFTRFTGTLPVFHFGKKYGFDPKDMGDLKGKVYVVTGANSGLGFGSTRLLAAHGAKVCMACRSLVRGEEAKAVIVKESDGVVSPDQLVVMALDNSDLKSVKAFATAYRKAETRLDGLLLNAGGVVSECELTKDGVEKMFGVNHLAHHALTIELLDMLEKNPTPATVVAVSSVAHYSSVPGSVYLNVKDLNKKENFNAMTYYGQSKLCNLLFVRELSKRLGPTSTVFVNAVHPGAVTGGFNKFLYGESKFFAACDAAIQQVVYWTEAHAALTCVAPLVSPKVFKEKWRGKYLVPIARESGSSVAANDPKLAENLWKFSEDLLREKKWAEM